MSNAIRCIDQRFAFKNSWYFVSGLDIQLKKSAVSALTRALFILLRSSLIFFFLDFVSGHLALTEL